MHLLLGLSLLVLDTIHAHSWIECLDTDRTVVFDKARAFIYGGQRAAGLCRGYQRDYKGRGIGIHDEELMVKILKDDFNRTDTRLCSPQRDSDGRGFHRRIAVAPDVRVFFAYMPNGHVAVDKAARGTLYGLYWSGKPGIDLVSTRELTNGRLLDGQRHDFDDKVCGQTYSNLKTRERSGRAGDDFPCVGEFKIPIGTLPGVYSIVWLWKFWDEKNDRKEIETVGGKFGGAAYISCFDVEVVPPKSNSTAPQSQPWNSTNSAWTQ